MAEHTIEIGQNLIPEGWRPVSYRRPNIGDYYLVFDNKGTPMVYQDIGNLYIHPVIILNKTND